MELTVQDIADWIEGRLREVVVVSDRYWVVKGRFFDMVFVLWGSLLCSVLQPCSLVSEAFSRWVSPHNPYVGTHKTGEQLEAIRAFLRKHTEILYVWFDFGCLSQREEDSSGGVLKDLNLAEEAYFGHALSRVNLLYLSAKVLILLDGEHITRFWCVYEAFLSGHEFDGTASVEEKSEAGSWKCAGHEVNSAGLVLCTSGSVLIRSATNRAISVAV